MLQLFDTIETGGLELALTITLVLQANRLTKCAINHKVKIVDFSGGTNEKILEKLDDIIREKPDDLIIHVGTNDISNNVNFLADVKKIFKEVFKESSSTSISFSSIINRKNKTNIQKNLTDMNDRLKKFFIQKRIDFII